MFFKKGKESTLIPVTAQNCSICSLVTVEEDFDLEDEDWLRPLLLPLDVFFDLEEPEPLEESSSERSISDLRRETRFHNQKQFI